MKWEYLAEEILLTRTSLESVLTALGQEGWELIQSELYDEHNDTFRFCIFKRPLKE